MPEIVADYIDRLTTIELLPKGVPRGHLRALYESAREDAGKPLSFLAASALLSNVRENDNVLIAAGAGAPILLPKGETDGPLGAAALARALELGIGATPIFVCNADYTEPIVSAAQAAGITIMDYDLAKKRRHAGAIIPVKLQDSAGLEEHARSVLDRYNPSALIAIEVKGITARGTMSYASGKEVIGEVRLDLLFDQARQRRIFTLGIGDNGNEIGFGRITRAVETIHSAGRYMASTTTTDVLVVGSSSNWGAYAVEAMLALLLKRPELLHSPDMDRRMLEECVRAGAGDGISMSQILAVDDQPPEIHAALLTLLSQMVRQGLQEVVWALRRPDSGEAKL